MLLFKHSKKKQLSKLLKLLKMLSMIIQNLLKT